MIFGDIVGELINFSHYGVQQYSTWAYKSYSFLFVHIAPMFLLCSIATNVNIKVYNKLAIYQLFQRELDLPSENASVKWGTKETCTHRWFCQNWINQIKSHLNKYAFGFYLVIISVLMRCVIVTPYGKINLCQYFPDGTKPLNRWLENIDTIPVQFYSIYAI